jgi:hypothetical protein
MPVDNGWSVTGSNSVNNGFLTAGTISGTYTVSYTDGCAQTASATVTVNNSNNGVTTITDGQASYKFNNTAQGPSANVYIGYNGFNYTSATKPTNTGFYKANNQSGNSAGCPYPFYIFRCTTCETANEVTTTTVTTATNRIWMDRNLGASQVATNSTDALAFGDLYQWGRGTDGHQLRTSSTTFTQSSIDQPGTTSFILASGDWRTTSNNNLWQGVNGTNNPCPTGFRIPTKVEWDLESASWSGITDAFNSPLKVTMHGDRRSNDGIGQIVVVGEWGSFWTSTISGNNAWRVYFGSGGRGADSFIRSWGFSVRCIKN